MLVHGATRAALDYAGSEGGLVQGERGEPARGSGRAGRTSGEEEASQLAGAKAGPCWEASPPGLLGAERLIGLGMGDPPVLEPRIESEALPEVLAGDSGVALPRRLSLPGRR